MSLEKVRLSNGLTLYHDQVAGARTNDATVFVPYGSVNEQPGNEGVAHVFEHSVFLKTDKFPTQAVMDRFDKLNGVEVNASTYFTSTTYEASAIDIEPTFFHLSQIVQHPHFPKKRVKHELKAIRREMVTALDDADEAHGLAAAYAMFGVPYGRSIGGYHDKLDFGAQALKDLHSKYYKLARMALVVTGAAELGDVVRLAEQYFQVDDDPTFVEEPVPLATPGTAYRTGLIRNDSNSVLVRVSHPLTPEFHEYFDKNRLAIKIAASVIRDTTFDALRNGKGISYDGGVDFDTNNHPNAWSFTGSVTTDPGKVGMALDTFSEVLENRGADYHDDDIVGTLALYKLAFNSIITTSSQRTANIINNLDEYREPEDMEMLVQQLDRMGVDEVRSAIDEIVGFVGSTDQYIHLTGSKKGVGKVDRMLKQSEIM